MELSQAWELAYGRLTCKFRVDKRSICCVFSQDMDKQARLEQVQRRIQFKILFMVPRCNKARGLAILWNEGFPLDVEKYSKNYIDTIIDKGKENAWRFTGFYGELDTNKRHEAWSKLGALKNYGPLPWLCARDFNEIA